jgi:hypothetical protein
MISESKMPEMFKMCLGLSSGFMKTRRFLGYKREVTAKNTKDTTRIKQFQFLLKMGFSCALRSFCYFTFVPFVVKNLIEG